VPRFSQQFLDQVAQATDIVELVSQYVALKKVGKEFVGLCPFHDDHKPSMYVSPAKQIFKCFVCGAGGGVFQWTMMYEKSPFPEAVEALAERAHIPVPQDRPAAPGQEDLAKPELIKVATFAARFFRDQLRLPLGQPALEYAHRRGLTDESIARFGLGFACDSWDALLRAARREGISEAQLLAVGLVVRRESAGGAGGPEAGDGSRCSALSSQPKGGCYDRFRNRLMFPILDVAGKVIAFGGRALDPNDRAKYLNSPETALFDKSASLYALNWSRDGISSSGRVVVVEGYLDALIPLQAGLNNVVATLGTALTDRHVRILSRYSREVVLVFDADAAGQAAAHRALDIFLAQQIHLRVATIPSGKDPCDYTLAEGGDAMRRLVDQAPDALQYAWNARQEDLRKAGDNLADRNRVIEDFLMLVVSSSTYGAIDEVRRGQLAQHIGHILNISGTDLQQQLRRLARRVPRTSGAGAAPGADAHAGALPERHILEVLLNRPDLFDSVAGRVQPAEFADADLRAVADRLWEAGRAGHPLLEELLASEEMSNLGRLLADLATAGERRGNYEHTLDGAVKHLEWRRSRSELQELKRTGLTDETLRDMSPRLKGPDPRRFPGIK